MTCLEKHGNELTADGARDARDADPHRTIVRAATGVSSGARRLDRLSDTLVALYQYCRVTSRKWLSAV